MAQDKIILIIKNEKGHLKKLNTLVECELCVCLVTQSCLTLCGPVDCM